MISLSEDNKECNLWHTTTTFYIFFISNNNIKLFKNMLMCRSIFVNCFVFVSIPNNIENMYSCLLL